MTNGTNGNGKDIAKGLAPMPQTKGYGLPDSMMWASGEDNFTPWSSQYGTYVGNELVDSATAIEAAGLDWTVRDQPAFIEGPEVYKGADGQPILDMDGQPIPKMLKLQEHKAMVRPDNYDTFGVVGKRYKPVPNPEAFTFLDSLVEDGELRYHTAGSLRGGKTIWILGQLEGNLEPVTGDPIGKFLLFSNTHDGTGAIRVFWTSIRVVCQNTWRHAMAQGKGKGMRFNHTQNVQQRLLEARQVLGFSRQAYDEIAEHLSNLAKVQMTSESLDQALAGIFHVPSDDDPESELHGKSRKIRETVVNLFENGVGSDIKGVRGTAYQVMNAITEYTNHHQVRWESRSTTDHRLHSLWFGNSAKLHATAETWLDQYMKGHNPEDITRSLVANSYNGLYTLADASTDQAAEQQVVIN